MNYDSLAYVVKLGGTVTFFAVFIGAIIYALWPKNQTRFKDAAQIPLMDTDKPDYDPKDDAKVGT
ncbi:MAG: cbb3-type cytochrome c oxidase subunit 3 [Robiginitomaculum sp.]